MHSKKSDRKEDDKETTGTAATLPETPPKQAEEDAKSRRGRGGSEEGDKKPAAKPDQASDAGTSVSTQDDPSKQRQVIAVSASKGPSAFFNLARKFLVTDDECDLSALEGAIISAVDAAHLLERSQLATIVSVQTSYVSVEPKRRKHASNPDTPDRGTPEGGGKQRELRRARIVITVRRTESYKQWLLENPLQAIIAGDEGDGIDDTMQELR